jgi:hypothetical protein
MRSIRQLFVALIVFASVTVSAQGWVEYINKTDLFIVNFPGEPAITETTHHSAYDADFPARVYTVDNERGRYQITVVDYRDTEAIHLARTNRTEANSSSSVWITDVQASIANAAQMFRTRGGEVTYDAWADIDKIAGHQLQITNPDQTRSFVSIHLHKSRLYILEGTVPAGAPAPGIFQQSLGVLDEEGRRIRYIMDVDGNLTRMEVMHEWIGVDPELAGDQLIE